MFFLIQICFSWSCDSTKTTPSCLHQHRWTTVPTEPNTDGPQMKLFTSLGSHRYVIMHTVLFAFNFPRERAHARAIERRRSRQANAIKKAQQISSDVNSRTHGSPKIFKKCPRIQTCLSVITPKSDSGNDHSLLLKRQHARSVCFILLQPVVGTDVCL